MLFIHFYQKIVVLTMSVFRRLLYSIVILIGLMTEAAEAQKSLTARKVTEAGASPKWGFVNPKGRFVVAPVYDTVFFDFHNGIAGVGRRGDGVTRGGIINRKGSVVLDFQYGSLEYKRSYILLESPEFEYGVADLAGKVIESPAYKAIDYVDGDTRLWSFDKWEVYTLRGERIFTCLADSLGLEDSDWLLYRNGRIVRRGIDDFSGEERRAFFPESPKLADTRCALMDSLADSLSVLYNMVSPCQDGLIAVERDKLYGFIDTLGRIRISIQYEDVRQFSEELAPVKILGKWGYIDRNEEIAIQPFFDEAWPFSGASAKVKKDGKYNFVDKKGGLRNAYGFDLVEENEFGNWYLRLNGKTGLANRDGEEIVIPRYLDLTDWGNGLVAVLKHGRYGVIDYSQNIIIPENYRNVSFMNNRVVAGNPVALKKIKYPLEK